MARNKTQFLRHRDPAGKKPWHFCVCLSPKQNGLMLRRMEREPKGLEGKVEFLNAMRKDLTKCWILK